MPGKYSRSRSRSPVPSRRDRRRDSRSPRENRSPDRLAGEYRKISSSPMKRSVSPVDKRSRSPPQRRRSPSPDNRRRSRSDRRSRSPEPRRRSRSTGGHHRSSNRADGRSDDRTNPSANKIIGVFGLSLRTTEDELYDQFSRYPGFVDVKLIREYATRKSRGFAFITFERTEDAVYVREKVNGSEIDGRPVRIDYSVFEQSKRGGGGPSRRGGFGGGRGRSRSRSRDRRRSYSRSPRR